MLRWEEFLEFAGYFGTLIKGNVGGEYKGIIVEGKTAYVSQEAFIMNETVRENILFGEPFNKERYDNIVSACEMLSDMELFINQDMTQVGEKGIIITANPFVDGANPNYTVTISKDYIFDLNGNQMAADYIFSFTDE